MIIILKEETTEEACTAVVALLEELGYSTSKEQKVIRAERVQEKTTRELLATLEALDCVERVISTAMNTTLHTNHALKAEPSSVHIGGVQLGGSRILIIAGPCSVETRGQVLSTAETVAAAGATVLRGGAYKPRTSPYDFQGHGEDGLKILAEARERFGLAIVTEVLDPRDVELVASYADMLQIGARNMHNTALLREVGRTHKPVLVKRGGMYPTIENWLLAAEYVMREGNTQVILCERGLPVLGDTTLRRNLLDLTAVPIVKQLSTLPIIVDPSHGTGQRYLISSMAKGAIAVGADGLMIEVHPQPERAWSDGAQSLPPEAFTALMQELPAVAAAVGRSV